MQKFTIATLTSALASAVRLDQSLFNTADLSTSGTFWSTTYPVAMPMPISIAATDPYVSTLDSMIADVKQKLTYVDPDSKEAVLLYEELARLDS